MYSDKTDLYNNLLKDNCIRTKNIYNKLKELNEQKKIEIANEFTQKNTINNNITLYNNITKEIVSGFDSDSYCNSFNINTNDNKSTNDNTSTNENKSTNDNTSIDTFVIMQGPEFINQNNLEQYNNINSSKYQFLDISSKNINNNFLYNNSYSDKSFLY